MTFKSFPKLPLIIGVFLIIYIGSGFAYHQQLEQQTEMSTELAVIQGALGKPLPERQKLEAELAQLKAELEAELAELEEAKAIFPVKAESIEVIDALLRIAEDCQVRVVKVEAASSVIIEVGGISYQALPITMEVEGASPQVLKFIGSLYWGPASLETAELKTVTIGQDGTTLKLYIYAYQGEGDV